ncbi:hypothetical protein [Tuwongella immobilis]|uniref:Uncharacterized protein n=1 Tax=Tuwongella immobilis TaxID=692036 RepID=A0A6C2YTP1_9BACT|nr:hypothetical protein [Tuwongella immobilis]VIP04399.1 unnamed protein product [Tuwongella immobilis]VTS06160.1 unnamed protein product [Tuwongella immobilis]
MPEIVHAPGDAALTPGDDATFARRWQEAQELLRERPAGGIPSSSAAESRSRRVDRLAGILRADAGGLRVIRDLLAGSAAERTLAGECLQRWPLPLPAGVLRAVDWLATDPELPERLRIHLVAKSIQSQPELDSTAITGLLQRLLQGLSPREASQRLHELGTYLPNQPEIATILEQLETRVQLRCPQCGFTGRRSEMGEHVWRVHAFVLDGWQIIEPWTLIGQQLDCYESTGQSVWLDRALSRAQQIDPVEGILRVNRLLLQRDRSDVSALAMLRDEARQRHATICPNCLASNDFPSTEEIPLATLSHGRFAVDGWAIEWMPRRRFRIVREQSIGMPDAVDSTPRGWSNWGLIWGLAVPVMLLALLVAIGWPRWLGTPFLPTLMLAIASAGIYAFAEFRQRFTPDDSERLLRLLWQEFIPDWRTRSNLPMHWRRIGAIAQTTWQEGLTGIGVETIQATIAALPDDDFHEVRATLTRLVIREQVSGGADAVPILAESLMACLDGRAPLESGDWLLADIPSAWLAGGGKARLRLLLLEFAFSRGWGVAELRQLARESAWVRTFWSAESSDDSLAQLRWLWQQSESRPWSAIGPAMSVLELARFPILGDQALALYPDLLWYQPIRDAAIASSAEEALFVTASGVVFRHRHLASDAADPIVKRYRRESGDRYELIYGELRLETAEPATDFAALLQEWNRYLHQEFLMQSESMLRYRAPAVMGLLRRVRVTTCRECGTVFAPRVGELGEAIVAIPAIPRG